MKAIVLAAGMLLSTACFSHDYRYDRYGRYDRYDRYDRSDRYGSDRRPDRRYRSGRAYEHRHRSRPVMRHLPPGARIQHRGGETYAYLGRGTWFVWDGYRRAWVQIR